MTFEPAVRENVPTLIGLAGGTGSGKTVSAMRIATGLAGANRFAVIDTENRRSRMYAEWFRFDVLDLDPPFEPARYLDAILEADQAGYPVIVVDSMSHEHAGDGGLLDMHDAEYQRLGGRDAVNMAAWIKPKQEHKRLVNGLLRVRAHVVLCFRAEPKVELVKNEKGKLEIVPKASTTGLDGWIPIAEKNLPYELTLSLLLTADRPGVPRPIKLPKPLAPMVPLGAVIDEPVGEKLAAWAAGTESPGAGGAEGARRETAAQPAGTPEEAEPNEGADDPGYRPAGENGEAGQEVGLTAPGDNTEPESLFKAPAGATSGGDET